MLRFLTLNLNEYFVPQLTASGSGSSVPQYWMLAPVQPGKETTSVSSALPYTAVTVADALVVLTGAVRVTVACPLASVTADEALKVPFVAVNVIVLPAWGAPPAVRVAVMA